MLTKLCDWLIAIAFGVLYAWFAAKGIA